MDRIQDQLTDHKNVSAAYSFLTSTDYSGGGVATKITCPTGISGLLYQIFVQKITLSVTVDNAATQQFQDSAGTPIPIAKSKVSPGLGPITWDFGTEGFPLTAGEDLQHLMSAAGMAGAVTIQAYAKAVNS